MEIYNDLFIIYAASLLTFALFAFDKHLAIYNRTRIPEFILLLFSFLGGAFGALCAMILFRHKTKHKMFLICVPVFLALQLAIDIIYRVFVLRLS
ncbi:MAG: DUF1294 domain-containing protein [Bacteroidaceae bacterium]|nr:DUF1294 domain-containing protein [Bacteroidaceae bacterium]